MNKLSKLFITLISAITLTLVGVTSSFAKVEGDYIVLGSAISLTGKYSSNGVHTQNGYNMAVKRINDIYWAGRRLSAFSSRMRISAGCATAA